MYYPDKAYDNEETISPAAGGLYRYFCKWRDHTSRLSRKGFERARADLAGKYSRASVYRGYKQLLALHWIKEMPDGRVMPIMGLFKPYDKLCDGHWREWQAQGLRGQKEPCPKDAKGEVRCLKNETGRNQGLKNETGNLKIETKNLKNETGHIKDRARDLSINPSINNSNTPHTHVESQPAREGRVVGSVCVSSKFSEEDLERYARNQTPQLGAGWVTEARRSGEWDGRVGRWLAANSAAAVAQPAPAPRCDHTCPRCGGSGYEVVVVDGKRGAIRCPNRGKSVEERANSPPRAASA